MSKNKKPTGPKSLFKYYKINKYSFSIFVKNQIYLSAPSSCNDPFDAALSFLQISSEEKVQEHLRLMAESRGESLPNDISLNEERENMNTLLQQIEKQIQTAGIYCMSQDPLHMLMWSHYADQHRGMCIEFERCAENRLGSKDCKKVSYVPSTTFLRSGFDFFREPEAVITSALYTKLNDWKYEKEWRLVYFWPHDAKDIDRFIPLPGKIKSITFGLRSPMDDMDLVLNASRLAMLDQMEPIDAFRIDIDRSNGCLIRKKMERSTAS